MAQTFTVTITDAQWAKVQEICTTTGEGGDITPTVADWQAWFARQLWGEVRKRGGAKAEATGETAKVSAATAVENALTALSV